MSIVQELQRDAIGSTVPTSEILRKSLVIAYKLKLQDFRVWVEQESEGYKKGSQIPAYRTIPGQLKAWNPFRGWIPVNMDSEDEAELSITSTGQPIGELEALVQKGGLIYVPYSMSQSIEMCCDGFPLQIALHLNRVRVEGIVQAVRSAVLKWALQLEADGIVGEGLSFSPEEKKMAESNSNQLSIGAIIGAMSGSQLQQNSPNATQSYSNTPGVSLSDLGQFTRELAQWVQTAPLSNDERAEVTADLSTVESQIESPKPKNGIISEGLKSIKAVLEKAAVSTLVAHAPDAAAQAGVWAKQLEGYLSSLAS